MHTCINFSIQCSYFKWAKPFFIRSIRNQRLNLGNRPINSWEKWLKSLNVTEITILQLLKVVPLSSGAFVDQLNPDEYIYKVRESNWKYAENLLWEAEIY